MLWMRLCLRDYKNKIAINVARDENVLGYVAVLTESVF